MGGEEKISQARATEGGAALWNSSMNGQNGGTFVFLPLRKSHRGFQVDLLGFRPNDFPM